MRTPARRWRTCAILLVLTSADAAAASWTVTPDITLRGTYTDNVAIGTARRERDFVSEATPGIRIDGRGPRLRAHLDYRPTARVYSRRSEANDIANQLLGFASLEAIERFFFIDAAANVSQGFISPFAPQPADLITITPNRVETRSFSVSPYLRGALGGGVEYELRNRNRWTSTNRSELGDVYHRQWTGRVGDRGRSLGWAVEFDDTDIEHEEFTARPDQESRLYRAIVYFRPDIDWQLHVSVGREENNFALQEGERHTMRGAGVSWRPTPRTRADLQYESRYFGPSRLARFTHRTRGTSWNVEYSRTASNFQEELLRLPPGDTAALLDAIFAARIPDPGERGTAVDAFVRATGAPPFLASPLSFFTQRIFVREGVDASFALLGARNSILFTAFDAESTRLAPEVAGIPADAFSLANRIRQRGFGARADHRFTPFTTVAASATRSYSRPEEPAGPESRNDYLTVTLNHTLAPTTRAFAGVSITRFDSGDAGLANGDATSVFVGLNHRF